MTEGDERDEYPEPSALSERGTVQAPLPVPVKITLEPLTERRAAAPGQ